jgi:hypothetical protein
LPSEVDVTVLIFNSECLQMARPSSCVAAWSRAHGRVLTTLPVRYRGFVAAGSPKGGGTP